VRLVIGSDFHGVTHLDGIDLMRGDGVAGDTGNLGIHGFAGQEPAGKTTQEQKHQCGRHRKIGPCCESAPGAKRCNKTRRQRLYQNAIKCLLQQLALTRPAVDLAGQFGITANAVAPGFIATDMTAATAERVGVSFDVFQKAAAERIPVRRIGQPSDVANTISFLVSDGAGYVSGQVIYVAGGPLC
jgi:NAD(P)-dependent dehydrogenase (short-subunit alcohol dehydrogenase family)